VDPTVAAGDASVRLPTPPSLPCLQVLQEEIGGSGGADSQWDASFDDDEFEMSDSPADQLRPPGQAAKPGGCQS